MKRILPYFLCIFLLLSVIYLVSNQQQSLEVVKVEKDLYPKVTQQDGIQVVAKKPYISRGEVGVLSVKSSPNASCKIVCNYKINGKLYTVTRNLVADKDGNILCTWKVDKNTDPGNYDIQITCGESRFITNYIVK